MCVCVCVCVCVCTRALRTCACVVAYAFVNERTPMRIDTNINIIYNMTLIYVDRTNKSRRTLSGLHNRPSR